MINQNTIITMLNEVIPQMQKSESPENTLLKYAKDQNLPPSILERMCHAFNQLKTNCYMDAAETMEKRGSQFSLIDAPTLIKKYTEFAGENIGKDFGDSIKSANSLWNIEPNTSFSMKIASEEIKQGNLSDIFEKEIGEKEYESFIDSLFNKELNKVASEDAYLTSKKEKDLYTKIDELNKTRENLEDYIVSLQLKKASIVNNIKKEFIKDESILNKFASFEADAIYLDDSVKDHMKEFIAELSQGNSSYYSNNIKRASEKEINKRRLIKVAHNITKQLIEYSDVCKCLKVANETLGHLKIAEDIDWDAKGKEEIFDEFGNPVTIDKDPFSSKSFVEGNVGRMTLNDVLKSEADLLEGKEETYKDKELRDRFNKENSDKGNSVADKIFETAGIKPKTEKSTPSSETNIPTPKETTTSDTKTKNTPKETNKKSLKDLANRAAEEAKKEQKKEKEISKEEKNVSEENTSDDKTKKSFLDELFNVTPQSLSDDVSKTLGNLAGSFNKSLDDLFTTNKSIMDLASKTSQKEHSKRKSSLRNLFDTTSDILFKKMMLTDPILSKLNKREIADVTEAYKTYKMQYPELAFQPALLKSVLRGAAQVSGGEDISTLKELLSARKTLADARKIEKDLSGLNVY